MNHSKLTFSLSLLLLAGCLPSNNEKSKTNKAALVTATNTDASQLNSTAGMKFELGSYKTADQTTKNKFEYIFQYIYGRKVNYTDYANNNYDLSVYPATVEKWADNVKQIIEVYKLRMRRLPTKREMIYWATIPVTNKILYAHFEKTVETLNSKSDQFIEDFYRSPGQSEWELQPVEAFVFQATPAMMPQTTSAIATTTTTASSASSLLPPLAISSSLSSGVKAIYQHIGRNADKIDAEGAAFFQSRLDAGVSLDVLKAQAMGVVVDADRKLVAKGVFQTSQQLLNGNETYRALYYRILSSAPVQYPAALPVQAITCNQLSDTLAWDSSTLTNVNVTATRTGFEIHFTKKSSSISYRFTNFDPVKAGFVIKFTEGGVTTTVPAEAYSQSPSSGETQKGFAYAYQGDYGSVNLKFHISRHRSLMNLKQPVVELSCAGQMMSTVALSNLKPMVDLASPPACKSILGKVVGDSCVVWAQCAKHSRATTEQGIAAQKGYSSCWDAPLSINPACPADLDTKYIGKCPLANPAELP